MASYASVIIQSEKPKGVLVSPADVEYQFVSNSRKVGQILHKSKSFMWVFFYHHVNIFFVLLHEFNKVCQIFVLVNSFGLTWNHA